MIDYSDKIVLLSACAWYQQSNLEHCIKVPEALYKLQVSKYKRSTSEVQAKYKHCTS